MTIPAIVVPQGNGDLLVRAGKPVVEGETIGTRRAAKILGLSQRQVQTMCINGTLESRRPGAANGNYRIPLRAVLERRGKL